MQIRSQLNFDKKASMLVRHVAYDVVLLGLCLTAKLNFSPWIACLVVAAGLAIFMFRSFSLMHEAVHGLLTVSSTGNSFFGYIYGATCLMPYCQWRQVHLDHHLWSGNVEKDPTMKIIRNYQLTGDYGGPMQAVAWKLWLPWLAVRQQIVFWSKSISLVRSDRTAWKSMAVAGLIMSAFLAGCVILFGSLPLFLGIIAYLTLVEVVNFPHHLALPQREGSFKLAPFDQHKISRTCVYYSWFERFVLLNFNFHVEHHLFPTLPWYELHKAHGPVKAALGAEYNFSHGNEWLRKKRHGGFNEVLSATLAPPQVAERNAGSEKSAA